MKKDEGDIKVGDLVFIRSCHTGKAMAHAGVCLVIAKYYGVPGDASLIKKEKIIFSILWRGFIDELVDPEWLILVKK